MWIYVGTLVIAASLAIDPARAAVWPGPLYLMMFIFGALGEAYSGHHHPHHHDDY